MGWAGTLHALLHCVVLCWLLSGSILALTLPTRAPRALFMISGTSEGQDSNMYTRLLTKVYGCRSPRNYISLRCTGGGMQALQWIFSTPGASAVMMDGRVPYS